MSICVRCKNPMTWTDQRSAFGVMKKAGITTEQIKAIGPTCPKCSRAIAKAFRDGGELGPMLIVVQ